eukprot:Phypoly_transcript_04067.p1 GENE.Phypoly_transcript_04067~~Phypoly_transcript_04067.p1  ORF type:complete len:711 (+),score=94.15 Phypoly_transcript_04067:62-2194(+)
MAGEVSRDVPSKWIAHIVLVGFHHAHGNHIEHVFPPLDTVAQREHQWEYLPFLAIPDGSHNSQDDYTFFVLPKTSDLASCDLYGVSCFMQIRTMDLPQEARTADITRTHVQKAVCILSYLPFFGPFHERLSVITHVYFNQRNFTDTEILESLYKSLETTYSPERPLTIPDVLVGIPLQDLALKLGRKLLVLFKFILLEQGVVIFSSQPVHQACTTVLGLFSLFPSGLDYLMPHFLPAEVRAKHSYHDAQNDVFGLPLQVFHKKCIFHPFITLQQIDLLNKRGIGFLVGTSNMLYIKNPPYSTAAIVEVANGNVTFPNEAFSRIAALSSSDRRFIDDIVNTVTKAKATQSSLEKEGTHVTSWEGSDLWIRAQFEQYMRCLLGAAAKLPNVFDAVPPENIDAGGLDAYNITWARAWLSTYNFRKWREEMATKCEPLLASAADLPVHPSGPPSALLDDLSDKLSSQLKDLEPTLTPLKHGIGSITSSTISTMRDNAIPLKNSLGTLTSSTLSNVRTNAFYFSKFLTDSADTFMTNYHDQMAATAESAMVRQRSNSAVEGSESGARDLEGPSKQMRRSHSIAHQPISQKIVDHPASVETLVQEFETDDTTTTSPTTTATTTSTTTATTNISEAHTEPTETTNTNQSSQPSSLPQSQHPTTESRHQDSVAVVAKVTAKVVTTSGRWFSALSSKIVDTVASLGEALEDEGPPAYNE